jgi:ethanolamine ammonia-lyase small subunit
MFEPYDKDFVAAMLNLATFRIVCFGPRPEHWPFARPVLLAREMTPEHRQVQVVVSPGENTEATLRFLPEVLPGILEGLTMRDLRTGQVMLPVAEPENLAQAVADRLLPDVVIHLCGQLASTDAPEGALRTHLLFRLSHRQGSTAIRNICPQGLAPESAAYLILDRVQEMMNAG